jgi:hypothetical protein
MMRQKNKHVAVRQSMLLAGLILASAGAQAEALPTITITGVVDTGIGYFNGNTPGSIAYDPSAWFGKAYTLEMTPDTTNVVGQSTAMVDIPGEFDNSWSPANVTYRLTIGGTEVFSGVDNQFSEVATLDDVTVPPGLTDVPAGIIDNHTYDNFWVSASGINLGCVDNCGGGIDAVYEYGVLQFERFWDIADGYNAIANANYPDLLSIDFNQGFGYAGFVVGRYSEAAGGVDMAYISFGIDSVTVAAVPEPETYALMLAGLGLIGWRARRRG